MAAPPILGGALRQQDTREAQRLINLVVDNFSANTIAGITINGGKRFDDTLGGFYPVVINPNGGMTINTGSTAQFIRFNNTVQSLTDVLIGAGEPSSGTTGVLFIDPDSTTTIGDDALFVVADRTSDPYSGFVVYPGYTGGTILAIADSAGGGTVNTVYQWGVNYPYFTGSAAAAGTANIRAAGADTNIWIYLYPKGAGLVGFQYAATALGGGAAPTLGTIGGSGPGTAGQAAWLAVVINSANYWIPVWQ